MGRVLSKSRLIAYRQCPKRVWLEVHRPQLREDSSQAQANFATGNRVGDIARHLYDPKGQGVLLDQFKIGFDAAFAQTRELLESAQPIFEAGLQADGACAFADVMLPVKANEKLSWKVIEVKSSTSVKDYHREDAAIQVFIAQSQGVALESASVACIDNQWVYPGEDNYNGLLKETDVTAEAVALKGDVRSWIADAQAIVASPDAPEVAMGKHCNTPFECGFSAYCQSLVPTPEHAISQLPGRLRAPLQVLVDSGDVTELRDVPDELLNDKQLRVKTAALSGRAFFDKEAAASALAPYGLPAYFMDFETTMSAIPIWKGTRPYQQIPFQFSVHCLSPSGKLEHRSFLDVSGEDPALRFAEALVAACDSSGPIYSYNASFETSRIRELAGRFPQLAEALSAVADRVVDLLPIARDHYYHPSQQGSWSIKKVLPALCPELNYDQLEGVQDGGMAMEAYAEAIAPETTGERKAEIERQLRAYCAMDTLALVRLWQSFSGTSLKVG